MLMIFCVKKRRLDFRCLFDLFCDVLFVSVLCFCF